MLLARDRIGDWPGAARPDDEGLLPETRSQDHQRRADGHGRAALQFRQRARGDGDRRRTARASRSPSGASRCPRRASCPRSIAGASFRARCSRSRCTRCATSCATSWCRSTRSIRSSSFSTPAARIPGVSNAQAHHVRIRDAQGRQRQPRPTPARWCGCWPAFRPRSISFRSIRGRAPTYECSDWETDRALRRHREQGGLCEPRAHAARPRHPRRVRTAQERERQASGARARRPRRRRSPPTAGGLIRSWFCARSAG